jgi:hypothetical protein
MYGMYAWQWCCSTHAACESPVHLLHLPQVVMCRCRGGALCIEEGLQLCIACTGVRQHINRVCCEDDPDSKTNLPCISPAVQHLADLQL